MRTWSCAVVLAVGLAVACRGSDAPPPPPPPPPSPPAAPVPISADTSAIEVLDADGGALAGHHLPLGDGSSEWALDGDAARGYQFAYHERGVDLAREPRHAFHAIDGGFELALTLPIADGSDRIDMPARLRVRDGALYLQETVVRRGTIALPHGPLAFALVGDRGRFDRDDEFIAFDLDRDGKLDYTHLHSSELFHVFERSVTIDGVGYAFDIAPRGERLTLRPLDRRPPPRPSLLAGSPAPDVKLYVDEEHEVSLASLRGEVVLLDFWATSCPPCVAALPRIAALRARLHGRGFEVFAVADPSRDVHLTLGSNATGIEVIDTGAAESTYRIDRFPSYFLIDADGTIACAHCSLDDIEPMIEPRLAKLPGR